MEEIKVVKKELEELNKKITVSAHVYSYYNHYIFILNLGFPGKYIYAM